MSNKKAVVWSLLSACLIPLWWAILDVFIGKGFSIRMDPVLIGIMAFAAVATYLSIRQTEKLSSYHNDKVSRLQELEDRVEQLEQRFEQMDEDAWRESTY